MGTHYCVNTGPIPHTCITNERTRSDVWCSLQAAGPDSELARRTTAGGKWAGAAPAIFFWGGGQWRARPKSGRTYQASIFTHPHVFTMWTGGGPPLPVRAAAVNKRAWLSCYTVTTTWRRQYGWEWMWPFRSWVKTTVWERSGGCMRRQSCPTFYSNSWVLMKYSAQKSKWKSISKT